MRWIPAVAFVLAAGMAGAFHLHARFLNDDALITIRYAEHLLAGHGLVYNPGDATLGTTTPLWALLLAAVGGLGVPMTAAASWIGVAATGWAASSTTLFLRRRGEAWTAQLLAAGLVATSPMILHWAGSGMETALYVALLATFLWVHEAGWLRTLGFVGGAMVLTRPDAGLVLAAAATLECVRRRTARPLLAVLPGFAVMVVPWLVGATAFYGSPLPNSGFAKRLQVEDWGAYLPSLLELLGGLGPLVAFAMIGMADSLRRPGEALVAWSFVAVAGGMALGGMPACHWYMPPAIHLFLVLSAIGAERVARSIAGSPAARTWPLWAAVVGAALLGHRHLVDEAREAKRYQADLEAFHGRLGDWLREHAPADAAVGVDNLGYIGYRSGLRVVDMRGLVQKDVMEGIAAGDRAFGLRRHRPELITMWVGRSSSPLYAPEREWFESNGYRVVFSIPVRPDRPDVAYTIFSRVALRGD